MPKNSPKRVREEARAYFDGRRVVRPMRTMVPVMETQNDRMVPVLDAYGHQLMEQVVCRNAAGEPVLETVWYQAPTVAGLCLHIGIDKTTFYRWLHYRAAADEDERSRRRKEQLREIAMEIEAVIEDYLTQRSFEKTASRGAIAQLEHNYWRSGNGPTAAGSQTAAEDAPMQTMAELEAELREMGILPGNKEDKTI